MKTCPSCPGKGPQPAENFNRNRSRSDGLDAYCRACTKVQKQRLRNERTAKSDPAAATAPSAPDFVPGPKPEPPPLEQAYARHEAKAAERAEAAQIRALIHENTRLKKEIGEAARLQAAAPSILVYDKAKDMRVDAVACALASDWHVEETVDAAAVHGRNEYSPEIARERASHFFRNLLKLTDIVARDSTVRTIYMAWLGDFFSGFLHEELVAANAMAPGDAAQFVKSLLCSGVDFLLRESSYQIEIDAIPGNHGRMTKQVWHADPTGTSLESFMYHAVADRYAGEPRVRLNVSGHAMVYRRFFESFTMRLIHGYEVKYGGGVGGVTIPLRKAIAQWDKMIPASLTALGHFHQRLDGGDFMVNGSMIGYNTFAQAIKASFEDPQQAFFMVHGSKGGRKSIVAPIWLDGKHTEATP